MNNNTGQQETQTVYLCHLKKKLTIFFFLQKLVSYIDFYFYLNDVYHKCDFDIVIFSQTKMHVRFWSLHWFH